jgi:adenylate cyclase
LNQNSSHNRRESDKIFSSPEIGYRRDSDIENNNVTTSKRNKFISNFDSLPIEYRVALNFITPFFFGVAIIFLASITTSNYIFLLLISLATFIGLGIKIIQISKKITLPLKKINSAAENINKGFISQIPEQRNDEIGKLIQNLNKMGKSLSRKTQLEKVLAKFLDPNVADKVMGGLDDINFKGENIYASALFADIVGFTEMSEKLSPSEVGNLLNEYFGYYSDCAKCYSGTIDKFLGDCVMIVFGAAKKDEDHSRNAIGCALMMQKITEELNKERIKKGLFAVRLRIGVNSGEMLAGLLGSKDRLEYTVIGDSVNLASRLCNEAKAHQTIIQEESYNSLTKNYELVVDNHKTIKIRGKKEPISIYNIHSLGREEDEKQQDFIDEILKGR